MKRLRASRNSCINVYYARQLPVPAHPSSFRFLQSLGFRISITAPVGRMKSPAEVTKWHSDLRRVLGTADSPLSRPIARMGATDGRSRPRLLRGMCTVCLSAVVVLQAVTLYILTQNVSSPVCTAATMRT